MRVAIGIPILDSVPGECFPSLVNQVMEVQAAGHEAILVTSLNLMPHDRARNSLLDQAKEAGADLLYFLDVDMIVPRGAFAKLLEALTRPVEAGAGPAAQGPPKRPVMVSAHCYRRGFPYTCVWSVPVAEAVGPAAPAGVGTQGWVAADAAAGEGTFLIGASGLACALIDLKSVLANLPGKCFAMDSSGDIPNEDVAFCKRVRAKGGLILGHADVRVGHCGLRTIVDDNTAPFLRDLVKRQSSRRA